MCCTLNPLRCIAPECITRIHPLHCPGSTYRPRASGDGPDTNGTQEVVRALVSTLSSVGSVSSLHRHNRQNHPPTPHPHSNHSRHHPPTARTGLTAAPLQPSPCRAPITQVAPAPLRRSLPPPATANTPATITVSNPPPPPPRSTGLRQPTLLSVPVLILAPQTSARGPACTAKTHRSRKSPSVCSLVLVLLIYVLRCRFSILLSFFHHSEPFFQICGTVCTVSLMSIIIHILI
jgi:hypothetical protein